MVLPEVAAVSDAVELAAINNPGALSLGDLQTIFFATEDGQSAGESSSEVILKEALDLAARREQSCCGEYPFQVTDRTIRFTGIDRINSYLFLLLGRSLGMGITESRSHLLASFQRYFEDMTCWGFRNCGFECEVLSIPREFRGLPKKLPTALKELSKRFGASAELDPTRILSCDNDLDVDIVAAPIKGNEMRYGWPTVVIQCATGAVSGLQSKMDEGHETFCGVWKSGFNSRNCIRSLATPYDLLSLNDVYWRRLSNSGWILDRTRLSYLCSFGRGKKSLPPEVLEFWNELWDAREEIDWRNSV